ncbi:sensor histidine kinase [Microbacterium abyssi]|uniref:sensor histidine kinase n=1 Tax=Microbacterium abyssi TaxID=2782166 RepID=UPI001889BFD7|nr:histidine kinase [Microbacterium sp. A18JL241]
MSTALPDAIGARRLNQGITATWWYTVSGVMVFQLMVLFIWLTIFGGMGVDLVTIAIIGIGGVVWCAASLPLLLQYRQRDDTAGPVAAWRGTLIPIVFAVVFGIVSGVFSGLWLVGALPLIQSLTLLNWPRGVRLRLLVAAMVVLAALWFIDWRTTFADADAEVSSAWGLFGFFAVALPAMTVMSLWWWDVLVTLDRARAAEARLGATQERLRVATDVHDLQGHHLQVIALQLELAERLLDKDPDAAHEQLRLARASVAEARQGTRDLAMRFRGVPLPDEIANAVDLLRAAGTTADAEVSPAAAQAPASVLGPVIRETTTNVLRHGGGRWARLSLTRHGGAWRYEIVNDAASDSSASDAAGRSGSSGLDGVTRRVAEAGGEVRVDRGKSEFHVVVTVPDTVSGPEGQR